MELESQGINSRSPVNIPWMYLLKNGVPARISATRFLNT